MQHMNLNKDNVMQHMTRLINLIYQTGKLPEEFLIRNFIAITKKPKATQYSDF